MIVVIKNKGLFKLSQQRKVNKYGGVQPTEKAEGALGTNLQGQEE